MLFLFFLIPIIIISFILVFKNNPSNSRKKELDENKILNTLDVEEKEKPNVFKRNVSIVNNTFSDKRTFSDKLDSYIEKEKKIAEKRKYNTLDDDNSLDFDDIKDVLTDGVAKILDFDPIEKMEKIEKAKRDLKSSDFLDSVKFKKSNKIYESIHISKIAENSKNFNADLFKKWSKEIFEALQLGSLEDKKLIKDFVLEELFDTIFNQEQQLENDNLKYIQEDFTINSLDLFDYSKSLNKEEIQILIKTTLREYIIDTKSKEILRGNKKLKDKKYLMTFKKRSDIPVIIEKNCPNCGGIISSLDFTRCKYCGSLIFPVRYEWILTKLEII